MSMLTTLINRKGCLEEVQIDFVARTLTISLAVLSHSLICARACQGKFDRARDKNFNPWKSSLTNVEFGSRKIFYSRSSDIEGMLKVKLRSVRV